MKTDILYATNKNYLTITLASILSLYENSALASNSKRLPIHLMIEGLTREDYELIDRVKELCPNADITLYPLDELDIEKFGLPQWRNTQVANARLFFQDVLEDRVEDMDKLLYLDSDTIVVDSLGELEQKEGDVLAVLDNMQRAQKLGISDYFNSGVLYIDVKSWLNKEYGEALKDFIRQNPNVKWQYPDQDVLNIALQGKIDKLPKTYNVPPFSFAIEGSFLEEYCQRYNIPLAEIIEARSNPKILHSTGLLSIKPWMINNVHPYNDIYRQYIDEVNPNYEYPFPQSIKGALAQHRNLFYTLFLLKMKMPQGLDSVFSRISNGMQTVQKTKK